MECLRTLFDRSLRVRVVGIERRVVVMGDTFDLRPLRNSLVARCPAVRMLPVETVVRNDQQGFVGSVWFVRDESHVLTAYVHVREQADPDGLAVERPGITDWMCRSTRWNREFGVIKPDMPQLALHSAA